MLSYHSAKIKELNDIIELKNTQINTLLKRVEDLQKKLSEMEKQT